MIIIYRYQIQRGILPIFRELIEKNELNEFNVIDTETIRSRLANPTTEVDEKVKYHIDNGLLISDAYLIDALIQNWDSKKHNILVDFPRNIEQLNVLKFHLDNLNDNIEKIIYYKVNDFDKIYDIAQNNYGKVYDADMKKQTIESMQKQMDRAEKMIEKLNDIPVIELDFLDENTKELK
ncbi:nucleoside monophosphate kinase [Tenacibaculum sp. S7007]|uniref:Nucleoside monophosphate kinase n=1 Tax=Tenacibaculum pelagium TaxID=2759527 RepID=A0A839AQ78_9FLAO|nr:nucleoside monophosphate kinase [Tenacibaculum pelagium]MBA6156508.1 nucleoside monophosphate kinase [Tenacibaculum pelagium]